MGQRTWFHFSWTLRFCCVYNSLQIYKISLAALSQHWIFPGIAHIVHNGRAIMASTTLIVQSLDLLERDQGTTELT
jgi:hypothetical protein